MKMSTLYTEHPLLLSCCYNDSVVTCMPTLSSVGLRIVSFDDRMEHIMHSLNRIMDVCRYTQVTTMPETVNKWKLQGPLGTTAEAWSWPLISIYRWDKNNIAEPPLPHRHSWPSQWTTLPFPFPIPLLIFHYYIFRPLIRHNSQTSQSHQQCYVTLHACLRRRLKSAVKLRRVDWQTLTDNSKEPRNFETL
jgi:hypothetical protein